MIEFRDLAWLPDQQKLNHLSLSLANEVVPGLLGYSPIRDFARTGTQVPGEALNGISGINSKGDLFSLIGTERDIFQYLPESGSWKKLTNSKKTYNANQESNWSFAIFKDYVLAINKNDPLQIWDSSKDGGFVDAGDSRENNSPPPRAAGVSVWGNFIVLYGLSTNPNSIQWSGLDDPNWWGAGFYSSDLQIFAEGGQLVGVSNSANPLIFMQNSIYKGYFLPGSEIIFQFEKKYSDLGCISEKSIATRENITYFISNSGIFQISNDLVLTNLSYGKIWKFIKDSCTPENLEYASIVFDPVDTKIYLSFQSVEETNKGSLKYLYDFIIVYDYAVGSFSRIHQKFKFINSFKSTGYTLDGLAKRFKSLDKIPYSLDSKIWLSSSFFPVLVDYENYPGVFAGNIKKATVVSQLFGSEDSSIQILKKILLHSDCKNFEVTVLAYKNLGFENYRFSPKKNIKESNFLRTYNRSRFFKIVIDFRENQSWRYFSGFSLELLPSGEY